MMMKFRRGEAVENRRLLVVEDHEETLNVLSRTLAAGGHDIVWARNADDTLKLLGRLNERIALIIVDVVLPGMSGPELVQKVWEIQPDVGAIYVSAFDLETVRAHGVDPETMTFVAKPYDPADLLHVVERTLARS